MTSKPIYKEQNGHGANANELQADPAEVRRFLEALTSLARAATEGMDNPGLLQIGQVHPLDNNGYVPTRYRLDDVEQMIADAIAFSNAGHNVYVEGRTVRAGLRGKMRGAAEDTVAVFALIADDDGDKDKPAAALPIKPTLLVETSPGNTHPWIFLKRAVAPEEGVVIGRALKAALGGDHNTGVITQPYRISGTVNYPTKDKLKRGRVVPVPTRLLATTRAYTIEEFNAAFPPPPPDCRPDKEDDNQDETVDRFMAEEMLSVIDPDIDHQGRLEISSALYNLFGEEVACALRNEWLGKGGHRPERREMQRQWRSITRKGRGGYNYNAGTLVHHATEANPQWRRRYEKKWWREVGDEIAQRLYHSPADPDWNAKFFKFLKQAPNDEPADASGLVEPPAPAAPKSEAKPEPKHNAKPEQEPKPQYSPPRRNGVERVCAEDIIVREHQWLWEGHLLRGAQELLTGLPGLGKSQVQIGLIACVTAGLPWPNGEKGMPPANIIMMTAEDALDQEVIPRLIAAGADLSRVHILKGIRSDGKDRQFLLGEDLKLLEGEVAEIGNVGLVTIDPITAYMGKIDSHKTTDVRAQLGPLKDFAERMNVAVSTITHPAKSTSQKAIDQFIGSQAFIAAGRIGHVCIEEVTGEENEKTGRILYTNAKNNPHTKMPTLAFRIAETIIGQDPNTRNTIAAPRVVWDKDTVNITADEAVRAASGTSGGKKSDGQKQAQEFLKEILSKGERVPVKDILAAGNAHGFTKDQLRLAKEKLGNIAVEQIREGWTWQWIM
ncbi:AAA family ATPase [Bradyrhizobium lablabi]|uniref:AAA family ATPase n=1 Tax=Bradyrhizobium lablabi TaxID=722472 RepID=UPI00090C30A4|nr:AAA family ATPase [Bradyrhizobium lablabi]SHL14938.1 RepB DNA-primase [Bradyrhizobium lablabi]